tara:strand:- start:210 stop:530 length:321 start_codon:yes stop_codon:yes gene_type:complete
MRNVLIDDENKEKLGELFHKFLAEKGWDGEDSMKLTYSFFHTLNLINSNIAVNDGNANVTFNSDLANIRASVIDEAIGAIRSCELVAPKVRRIHLDAAVGALIELK